MHRFSQESSGGGGVGDWECGLVDGNHYTKIAVILFQREKHKLQVCYQCILIPRYHLTIYTSPRPLEYARPFSVLAVIGARTPRFLACTNE